MKRLIFVICMFSLISFIAGMVNAFAYTFQPTPDDMDELTHQKYYLWKLNWSPSALEYITEAVLTFDNIWDWRYEKDDQEDHLYTHLIDNPSTSGGTKIGFNSDSESWRWTDPLNPERVLNPQDDWASAGPLVGVWSDPLGGYPRSYILEYKLSTLGLIDELNLFASDGNFGFGFDPDCHYFNDGITLVITTAIIPEPTSLFLLGTGLLGLFGTRIRRKRLN